MLLIWFSASKCLSSRKEVCLGGLRQVEAECLCELSFFFFFVSRSLVWLLCDQTIVVFLGSSVITQAISMRRHDTN